MARYDTLADTIAKLKGALKSPAHSARVLEAILAISEGGAGLGAKNARKIFTDIFPDIVPALRSDPTLRIVMDALQRAYDTEVSPVMKFTDELDWFLRSQSKLVDELRTVLTNLDIERIRFYLQVTGERAIAVQNIARSSYLPKIAGAFINAIGEEQVRLERLLQPFIDKGVIEAMQKSGFISDFHFWRIKGEITEILCLARKLEYLADVQKTFPNAQLFEGVMANTALTKEGLVTTIAGKRQIWDGIIGEITPNGLRILVKFEVKSGLHGFEEGAEQILRTHHSRFSSKLDELYVVVNGQERTFVLGTKGANSIDLARSENVLMTPLGESHVLPNQILELDKNVPVTSEVISLGGREITSSDIEALVVDLLQGLRFH